MQRRTGTCFDPWLQFTSYTEATTVKAVAAEDCGPNGHDAGVLERNESGLLKSPGVEAGWIVAQDFNLAAAK